MITTLSKHSEHQIYSEIESHSAFLGYVPGLRAEKMMRGQKPFTFVLRAGESETDFYVTFVKEDGSVHHQPFDVTVTHQGWFYENAAAGGPYKEDKSIMDVLHLIMHCDKDECVAFEANQIVGL